MTEAQARVNERAHLLRVRRADTERDVVGGICLESTISGGFPRDGRSLSRKTDTGYEPLSSIHI